MSRVQRNKNGWQHFVMICDEPDCKVESPSAASERQLRLIDFRTAGWFIAQHFGDCCPSCKIKGRHLGRAAMPWSILVAPALDEIQKNYLVEVPDEIFILPDHVTLSRT